MDGMKICAKFQNFSPCNRKNYITKVPNNKIYSVGHPRKIDIWSCLGFVLRYFGFTGAITISPGWFELTATSIYVASILVCVFQIQYCKMMMIVKFL